MRTTALLLCAACCLSSLASQAPLPAVPVPPQNPITPAKSILGKLLFWEEQLSSNNRVACGTCHTFAAGGGDLRRARHPGLDGVFQSPDDSFGSPGVIRSDASNHYLPDVAFGLQAQITQRASPGFLTAAWFPEVFWDGRARTDFIDPTTSVTTIPAGGALENQALGPLLAPNEMAHDARTFAHVTQKLTTARPMALATNLPADMAAAVAGGATYPQLFAAAFGTTDITPLRIAYALATYQRTLVPNQAPYDLFVAGNPQAMTQQQVNGMNVFNGPGRCNLCHTPGLFSDRQYRNLGLRPIAQDNGRQAITGLFADRGKFKVPSLRNAGLRQSFMHNGQFTTVGQVFGFYLNGGGPNLDNKDPLLVPLNVPPQAAADLINFVANALTDPRVAQGLPPFTRPVLRSDVMPAPGFVYGPGSVGTGGRIPAVHAEVPANIGNPDFKLGVSNARGGALATVVINWLPASTQIFGVNLNVGLNGSELLATIGLGGASGAAGAGYGTLAFGLPSAPFLAGLTFYGQWFVWDGGVPTGAASTRGAEIRFF
ncbi:MAG TPA: cytochrome c peroxidase [Planctomycetota bacterium]